MKICNQSSQKHIPIYGILKVVNLTAYQYIWVSFIIKMFELEQYFAVFYKKSQVSTN